MIDLIHRLMPKFKDREYIYKITKEKGNYAVRVKLKDKGYRWIYLKKEFNNLQNHVDDRLNRNTDHEILHSIHTELETAKKHLIHFNQQVREYNKIQHEAYSIVESGDLDDMEVIETV